MPDPTTPGFERPDTSRQLDDFHAPIAPVKLSRVPLPLDGSERFQWRLAAVLIALSACRGKTASVEQLHTLVWAMNDPANAQALRVAWEGETTSLRPRGYVVGLLQTLKVAQVEGLVEQQGNGRQKLTEAGSGFVSTMANAEINFGAGQSLLLELAPISSAEMNRRLGGRA